ncbi:Nif3-like dinuclear metal center hexameric protein [Micrococcus sp.]|uniref:Nif3-like dinuclear metal center hexameric protein n=1 Tax=Micrococcus sp. TaxID=1271 RepID=UPI002A917C7E|nr:Nif3-like dinuclear metal center hexameric protein [Micrococcus sp.]MDY6054326.1 Nif3-like dinuclear metal center hexameric protein [Micrococcus sp.]
MTDVDPRPDTPEDAPAAGPAPTLAEVLEAMERLWPRGLAESWDAVGPVAGRPGAEVRHILWAVDPVQAVVEEAVEVGADLLVTHHPLLLRGVSSVAAVGHAGAAKGALLHTLIEHGVALVAAHTNADSAVDGVSDAIARRLGLQDLRPLAPTEEGADTGIGRVGELADPVTLAEFARTVADTVPRTAAGVRAAGDPGQPVRRVAVCGGAGDSLFDAVRRADADVYLTSDLRHHPASEARETALLGDGRPALVDVAHWASESLWLEDGAAALAAELVRAGHRVRMSVSTQVTDPWDLHLPGPTS